MPCENTLYCFKRKQDAEQLAADIKKNKGQLSYCTVSQEANCYSLMIKEKTILSNVTFADVMAYILRKFW